MNKQVEEIIMAIGMAEEFKPVVEELFNKLALFGEEFNSVIDFLADTQVRYLGGIYNGLLAESVSSETAEAIVLGISRNLATVMQNNFSAK